MPSGKAVRSWRHFALVGLCLALAYALGVANLKSHPLMLEEWDSIKHLATAQTGPINSIAQTIESVNDNINQDHAPGYFVLLNVWSRLTGLDLFTLRLFSVFCGLLALVFGYRLALICDRPETAVDAALLLTFTAFVLFYTYIVRMYALLPVLSAAVLWSYWRIASRAGAVPRRLWLAFVAASAAILWVHYFGTILLAALGVYHLVVAPKNSRWFRLCLAAICVGLLFAPWLPVLVAGVVTRKVPTSDALSFIDSAAAIASIYTNGLPLLVPLLGFVAVATFARLKRSQRFVFIVVAVTVLLLLISNEFAPLLIARRIRYTLILALPWACALAIGLNRIPRWRFFRIPFLALWLAAAAAYANSDQILLYTNRLTLKLHKTPPYQDLLYEPAVETEKSDYIVSFHVDTEVNKAVHAYYDSFHGRWAGLKHIRMMSDGSPSLQTTAQLNGPLEHVAFWRFRVWVVYNPEQTNVSSMSAFTEGFLEYFRSCGALVEKRNSVIELFGPKDFPCELLTATDSHATRIQYDNGSVLGNVRHELGDKRLGVYLWWVESERSVYAYSLQIFDEYGSKVGPQIDTVISDEALYAEDMDLSSLSAGAYVLKLIVYDAQTVASQPGILVAPDLRFERDIEVARFSLEG